MARGKGEKKAMSRKEIQQKYVNKMKSEKSEEWRQRRKERNQKLRENRSEEKKIMLKIQNREQKKAKRAEEKAKKQSELLEEKQKQGASAYKTKAAYGKAKSKALKGLPEEQERAMEVVLGMKRTLERRMGPREEVWEEEEDRGVKSTSKLLVQKFFFRQVITIVITTPVTMSVIITITITTTITKPSPTPPGHRLRVSWYEGLCEGEESWGESCQDDEVHPAPDAQGVLRRVQQALPRGEDQLLLLRHPQVHHIFVYHRHHLVYKFISNYHKEITINLSPPSYHHQVITITTRPANVLLRHKMPSNVCTCVYHVNINYLISAVHRCITDFPRTTCTSWPPPPAGGRRGWSLLEPTNLVQLV